MKILPKNIGILAYLGPFMHHKILLENMGAITSSVKTKEDLEGVDALIIPGSEVASLHFALAELLPAIFERVKDGMPLFLTGEASVLLSHMEKTALSDRHMIIEKFSSSKKKRFNENIRLSFSDTRHFEAKFVRPPSFQKVAKGFSVLANKETDGEEAVMIEKDQVIACSFYPELGSDPRIHEYFLTKI